MTTIHVKNGVTYQIGNIVSPDGSAFDMTVYVRFPTEEQYEQYARGEIDEVDVVIAGWHFGEYAPDVADAYIDK